jgi:integrase
VKDQKSDAEVMPKPQFGKTDVRYWSDRIFHRQRGGDADKHWTAQMQHAGRREQFPLGTPNKAAAAAKARSIYLSLQASGWETTLAAYKAKPEEPKPEFSTIGDLIREVANTTAYRSTTFSVYCAALRRIAVDIAGVQGSKKKFAPQGAERKAWREKVDSTPLPLLTKDAVQHWKLSYIGRHKDSPEEYSRAVNTVNSHIRNARSLFTPKALEFAGKRLMLPSPLPFAGIKLERKRGTTRYSSRIDPSTLLVAAQGELAKTRQEQFKIFCLALLCGLRRREIDTLLWRSVDLEKAVIRIERTQYFQPKSEESAGEVDLAKELVDLMRAWKAKGLGEFVIASPNPPRYETSRTNYRAQRDFEALGEWLASKGVSANKKLHELRKECGSVIANSMGIFAASRALRHADIRITSQYYADKKVRITTGLDALLA